MSRKIHNARKILNESRNGLEEACRKLCDVAELLDANNFYTLVESVSNAKMAIEYAMRDIEKEQKKQA